MRGWARRSRDVARIVAANLWTWMWRSCFAITKVKVLQFNSMVDVRPRTQKTPRILAAYQKYAAIWCCSAHPGTSGTT